MLERIGRETGLRLHTTTGWNRYDRAVEAMLASVREPCTASQLASGLGWTLPRTVDALEHLEPALAHTARR